MNAARYANPFAPDAKPDQPPTIAAARLQDFNSNHPPDFPRGNVHNRPPKWGRGGNNRGRPAPQSQRSDNNWDNPAPYPPNPHHRGYSPRSRPFSNFSRGGRGHPYHAGPRPENARHNFRGQQNNKCYNSNNQHEKDSPWMTPELLKLIQEKDELWKVCNDTRSEENHRKFKIKRFEVNMAVNDAKILFRQQNPQFGQHSSYTQVFRRTVTKPEFYCDPCEKEFISQEQLEEHKTEHITCKLDGCQYTAHVKLVMKHIELQHATNLFQRIKGYDTPEGVEKWKEERRKNFPTPENTLRKKAEIAERKARGDILTAKEDFPGIEIFRHKIVPEERKSRQYGAGYQSDGNEELPFKMRSGASRFMNLNKSPAIQLHNFYTDVVVSDDGTFVGSTRETWTSLKNNDGCNEDSFTKDKSEDHNADEEFNITDDEDDGVVRRQSVILKSQTKEIIDTNITTFTTQKSTIIEEDEMTTTVNNNATTSKSFGLAGLVGYESNPDSDIEQEDGEIKSGDEDTSSLHPVNVPTTPSIYTELLSGIVSAPLSSDDEAPDEIPTVISKEEVDLPTLKDNSRPTEKPIIQEIKDPNSKRAAGRNRKLGKRSGKQSQTHMQRAQSVRRKYTLLQRLLAPDIRREKNMVLQVCRFLVDRNFLDPNKPQTN